jgi:hypothetical protein
MIALKNALCQQKPPFAANDRHKYDGCEFSGVSRRKSFRGWEIARIERDG